MALKNLVHLKFALLATAWMASASPANAAWHESKSRHFIVYGDASPAWLRAYSLRLEKFDQAVRRLQKVDDPPPGEAGRVTIFILPDNEAVSKMIYGQKTTVAGSASSAMTPIGISAAIHSKTGRSPVRHPIRQRSVCARSVQARSQFCRR